MSNILDHFDKAASLYADWLKNLAAVSVVAITILVSVMPETPPEAPDKYFLAACWILLAICIPCSLGSSFRPIIQEKFIGSSGLDLNQQPNAQGKIPGSDLTKELYKRNMQLLVVQFIAVITFCLAFISLAIYGCLSVL